MLATLSSFLLAEGVAAGSPLGGFLPIILMVGVFYFLVIRPQSKLEKDRKARIAKLEKGDQVRLTGGILGRVTSVEDAIIMVEVADKVRLKVLRAEIADIWAPPAVSGTVVKVEPTATEARS